jgi:hypothetical protein
MYVWPLNVSLCEAQSPRASIACLSRYLYLQKQFSYDYCNACWFNTVPRHLNSVFLFFPKENFFSLKGTVSRDGFGF